MKFTAFAFMHGKPSCVFINYENLHFLICFSQHLSYALSVAGNTEGNEAVPTWWAHGNYTTGTDLI